MKDNMKIEFNMEQKMCNDCKKISTEYYELKLQLRFDYFSDVNVLEDKKKEIRGLIEKKFSSINKVDEIENGFDFYFRSHGVMNKISNLINNHCFNREVRTKKIVGHDFLTSKDIWRHTQLIKILNLNVKDEITIKGEKYYIKAFNKNDLVLRHLVNGSKEVVNYNIIRDYLKLIKKYDKNKDKVIKHNKNIEE